MAITTAWRALKFVVKHADEVAPPAYLALRYLLDNEKDVAEPGWHRIIVKFSRQTPASTVEDFAQFKLDLLKIADDGSDNAWVAGDFTAIATALDTFTNTMKPYVHTSHAVVEYRAYRMRYNAGDPGPEGLPAIKPKPFQDSGGPVYILTKNLVGTGSQPVPYQVTATATLKTGLAKHWGRIYYPGVCGVFDGVGRLTSGFRTSYANGMFDLQDDLQSAGFLLVVPATQMGKRRFHGLFGVSSIVVDDIPDVIRRRRPKQVAARTTGVE